MTNRGSTGITTGTKLMVIFIIPVTMRHTGARLCLCEWQRVEAGRNAAYGGFGDSYQLVPNDAEVLEFIVTPKNRKVMEEVAIDKNVRVDRYTKRMARLAHIGSTA